MTGLTKPNRVAIGQLVYDVLDEIQKSGFEVLNVGTDVWSYVSDKTGEEGGGRVLKQKVNLELGLGKIVSEGISCPILWGED